MDLKESQEFSGLIAGKPRISYQNDYGGHRTNLHLLDSRLWIILSGQAGVYVCSMLMSL